MYIYDFHPLLGTPFTDCDPKIESLWCCVIVRKGVSFDIFFVPHEKCKTFEIYLEEREGAPREVDFGVHSDHLWQ